MTFCWSVYQVATFCKDLWKLWAVSRITEISELSQENSTWFKKTQKACLVRPLKIAARRANELMCVIKYVEGMEDAEWLNEEVYQDSFPEESDEVVTEGGSNIITDTEKWLEQPWSASEWMMGVCKIKFKI
ncbi:hypothetical protein AVEN_255679-1 [Araneus ventricosus]|uniref:Uncharacterized protein n=1 Tax=Araneus ventricosus TaxID=182803 RepID=A0A4Y2H217_ARAVE|nr:hypothetical protein AVEN_255679-1 [Araneus ventricosus]